MIRSDHSLPHPHPDGGKYLPTLASTDTLQIVVVVLEEMPRTTARTKDHFHQSWRYAPA